MLPELVQGLVSGLCESTEEQIRNTFDLNKISKDALIKGKYSTYQSIHPLIGQITLLLDSSPTIPSQSGTHQGLNYRSRIRTEPTNLTVPQWTAALWERLDVLMESMAAACIKVRVSEVLIWGAVVVPRRLFLYI